MPPSRILKPRFDFAETPRLQEIPALNFVLAPPKEFFKEPSVLSQTLEAMQAPTTAAIDVRLFGPRPLLDIETSVDLALGERALVRVEPAKKSLVPLEAAKWQLTLPHPIQWIKKHKFAAILGGIASIGLGIWGTFLYFFPVQTLLIMGGELLALTGIIFSYKGVSWVRDTGLDLFRSSLFRLMSVSRALSKPNPPLALPPGSEGEGGPFRSSPAIANLSQVRKLIDQVLKPTREFSRYPKYSDRAQVIRLLGESLEHLSPQQPEFRQGVEALHQILKKSPVVRYSSRSWQAGRKEINLAVLETLADLLEAHPELTQRRDYQLIPVAETALAILSNRGMLERLFRQSRSNKELAFNKSQKLLEVFSQILSSDHPQTVYCRAAIGDYFFSLK